MGWRTSHRIPLYGQCLLPPSWCLLHQALKRVLRLREEWVDSLSQRTSSASPNLIPLNHSPQPVGGTILVFRVRELETKRKGRRKGSRIQRGRDNLRKSRRKQINSKQCWIATRSNEKYEMCLHWWELIVMIPGIVDVSLLLVLKPPNMDNSKRGCAGVRVWQPEFWCVTQCDPRQRESLSWEYEQDTAKAL